MTGDRVAVALERIAAALEVIAGDMTGDGVPASVAVEQRSGDSGVRCGACGSPMVRRHRKRDGNPFFGCSLYPECTETIDIGDPSGDRDDDDDDPGYFPGDPPF